MFDYLVIVQSIHALVITLTSLAGHAMFYQYTEVQEGTDISTSFVSARLLHTTINYVEFNAPACTHLQLNCIPFVIDFAPQHSRHHS